MFKSAGGTVVELMRISLWIIIGNKGRRFSEIYPQPLTPSNDFRGSRALQPAELSDAWNRVNDPLSSGRA